jgi:hypothetical protein
MNPKPLTLAQSNELLAHIYRALRQRRPALFRAGEPWRPGGVSELQQHLPDMLEAARSCNALKTAGPSAASVKRILCARCERQTPCGYCAFRDRDECVMVQEWDLILDVVRRWLR